MLYQFRTNQYSINLESKFTSLLNKNLHQQFATRKTLQVTSTTSPAKPPLDVCVSSEIPSKQLSPQQKKKQLSPQTQTPIWKDPPPFPSITGTIPRSRDTHYLWGSPRGVPLGGGVEKVHPCELFPEYVKALHSRKREVKVEKKEHQQQKRTTLFKYGGDCGEFEEGVEGEFPAGIYKC